MPAVMRSISNQAEADQMIGPMIATALAMDATKGAQRTP
jgi:hypothetical protein